MGRILRAAALAVGLAGVGDGFYDVLRPREQGLNYVQSAFLAHGTPEQERYAGKIALAGLQWGASGVLAFYGLRESERKRE